VWVCCVEVCTVRVWADGVGKLSLDVADVSYG